MAKAETASLGMEGFTRSKDLVNKVLFTLLILIVYRFGTYVPLPGVNPAVLTDFFQSNSQGILGIFDMFSGGALGRMTIFSLNIMPYIAASIIMQLVTFMYPSIKEVSSSGESGRTRINQYTRYLTIVICLFQGLGVAIALEGFQSSTGVFAVSTPGLMFKFLTVVSLTSGTFLVLWLGEQITARGVGNGVSLIVFAGIIANLPSALVYTFELTRKGSIPLLLLFGIIALIIAVVFLVVFVETSQRRISINYPRRSNGMSMMQPETSYIPLKLNTAGVIPPIFASSILVLPITLFTLLSNNANSDGFLANIVLYLGRGQPLYLALYASLIVAFAFFYVGVIFNSKETADNLKKSGAFIPGVRPGTNTSDYFNTILNRLTTIGSVYLVFVCLLPEFLISKLSIPFYFGGTSLLIVVSVTIDTITQIQSHLMSYQYESMIKKSKLSERRRKTNRRR